MQAVSPWTRKKENANACKGEFGSDALPRMLLPLQDKHYQILQARLARPNLESVSMRVGQGSCSTVAVRTESSSVWCGSVARRRSLWTCHHFIECKARDSLPPWFWLRSSRIAAT